MKKLKAKRGEALSFTQHLVENSGYVVLSSTENRVLIASEVVLSQLGHDIELLGVRVGDWPKQAVISGKIWLVVRNTEESVFTTQLLGEKKHTAYSIHYDEALAMITNKTHQEIIEEIQQAKDLPTEIPMEVHIL